MRVVPLSLSLSSENREEKMATWNLGGEAVFSLAVFFRVRHDGLSEGRQQGIFTFCSDVSLLCSKNLTRKALLFMLPHAHIKKKTQTKKAII